ncbi:MAG: hypothetical protein H6907_06890 [Hyphomicrobiales bacterium]|nr:hypothetical protein [Hyphomicrobiales bacterium]
MAGPNSAVLALATALALTVAGCGGRVARPVPATTAFDDQLTCAHIAAQIETGDARIADLGREAQNQSEQNVAKLLFVGVIWMNLNDSEKEEITALQARRARLQQLKAEKNCP